MTMPDILASGLDQSRVDAFIWEVVSVAFHSLDEVNGSGHAEITLRLLKIGEEYGEAIQAWIGVTGQNPRKGVTHSRQQVAGELGDIAITALVAASSMGFDPRQVLADTAAKVAGRFGLPGSGDGFGGTPAPGVGGSGGSVDEFIWNWVSADFRTLDGKAGNEADEISLRLLKIAEEYGEAAQAWIGATGQNPRKGVTNAREQVADELGDVAFGALVTASSMGFDPRQVLADTATKVAARFGIRAPWPGTDSHPVPAPAARLAGEHSVTAAPLPDGEPVAGDLLATLVEIADAQTRRFPGHNGPLARAARLAEETGEVAQQVNRAEGTGIKNDKYGPFDPANLAGEIANVMQAAAGIAAHYDITDLVRAAIAARHTRYHQLGLLPGQPVTSASAGPDPVEPPAA